jgi:hypothetical protein
MRLPRMTTRRWMAAVAIVAVAIGGEMMRRRSVSYRGQANRYALAEAKVRTWGKNSDQRTAEHKKHLRKVQSFAESGGGAFRASWKSFIDSATRSVTLASEEAERFHRLAAHYAALRMKYERAARYPWLPVEPDPPKPE